MRKASAVSSAILVVVLASAAASEAQDKVWNALPPLHTARSHFALTRLADGRLLAAGGIGPNSLLTDCEIYDPVAQAWTATAPLPAAWPFPELFLLGDGRVLLAGASTGAPLLFDPSTATWTATTGRPRSTSLNHGVLLADGRVFLMGRGVTIAEIFDPSTDTWADTSAMDADRADGTLTLLADGRVLVAGGYRVQGTPATTGTVYDPATNSWTTTGPLVQRRDSHSASRLLDGLVLIAGGRALVAPYSAIGSAETYDPATNAWTATAGSMAARYYHTATLLSSGQVLLAGGMLGGGGPLTTVQGFDPATGLFVSLDSLKQGRYAQGAATFSDGTPVLVGGVGDFNETSNVEVYSDPLADAAPPSVSLVSPSDGSEVSGVVTFEATASDDTGVVSVGFYEGPYKLLCEATAPPYQCNWNSATVYGGTHTLVAKARDWANKTAQSSVTVTVLDLIPPSVSLTKPVAGSTAANPMLFEATASDISGIGKVEFLVDGVVVGSDDVYPYQARVSASRVGAGTHLAAARATDKSGNVSTTAAVQFVAPVEPVLAIHDPALGAPACGGGGDCDSGTLLVGRGPLGPEPHMPNTIGGTCSDGFSGTFHNSESVDRLRIRTTDASSFAAGKTVTVEATVWTASVNDRVDIYYATDAQSPLWTLVTTVNPGYPGQRFVTIQFPLVAGADRQAIRAVLRWGNTPVPGQPACFGSGRDDHDDLAFTLGVPTSASGGATYDASLRTPACFGFGTECDSLGFLIGRGSSGLEPNQSNTTLDSCADGTSGTYQSSPSADRIRIVSTSGPLRRGGSATIQVTVYAHWGSTYERLHLYEAIDTSGTWRYLGSVTPSGFGTKVLSLPYSLIGSTTARAVRAAYRLNGPPPTLACAPGANNDHDDLWFRVDAPTGSHSLAIDGESEDGAAGSVDISSSGTSIGTCAVPGKCFQDVPDGSSLTLTPTAAPGSLFTGFTGACSGLSACTLPMSEARQVGARFKLDN